MSGASVVLRQMNRPRLLSGSLVGAADQALLSAFNLLVGLAFIRFASKTEYASYALAATVVLLLQSVQNALINSPLATLVPAATQDQGRSVAAAGLQLQQSLVGVVAAGGVLLGGLAVVTGRGPSVALIFGSTVAAVGVAIREYRRGQCFLRHDPAAALRGDLAYVAFAVAGLAGLLITQRLTAAAALAAIGCAGLLSGMGSGRKGENVRSTSQVVAGRRSIWQCAKWALPSVLNSWLYANAYLFLVERLISKEAVADLSATRLLLVPLSLLVVGWASAFRPRASQWFAAGDVVRVHRAASRSAFAFVAAGCVYGLVLYGLLPWLQPVVLGDKYQDSMMLLAPWLLFVMVTSVRSVWMSAMLASAAAFKTMYVYSWLPLLVAFPGVVVAGLLNDVRLVLIALIAAELALCAVVWFRGWPATRRSGMRAAPESAQEAVK